MKCSATSRLRKLAPAERRPWLEAKRAERAALRARIQELTGKRDAFVREEVARKGLDDGKALDRALKDAIRQQAAAAGFTFR
jgi:hypothetical protein